MPRISMWNEKKGADYRWFDRTIAEMFVVGGTGLGLHKYLGPAPTGLQMATTAVQPSFNTLVFANVTGITAGDTVSGTGISTGTTVISANPTTNIVTLSAPVTTTIPPGVTIGFTPDATLPSYTTPNVANIQDVLFLENRDRIYAPDVYLMRGIYQRTDNDFDLSQFGVFLQSGTIMMVFHYNEMIAQLGRKIMSGDVIEMFHLKDDDVLDLPFSLKRFYVVGDCSWATEGFSPTWYPHLWRAKLTPLVDSQEYKGIIDSIIITNSSGPQGSNTLGNTTPLGTIISTYDKYLNINEAILQEAETEVPKSGYDVSKIYSLTVDKDGNPIRANLSADDQMDSVDGPLTADAASYSPGYDQNPKGYLTGDGLAPNGLPVGAGISFPMSPQQGDYFLRLDYLPNRLFRFSGSRWVKIEDNVRTNLTAGPTSVRGIPPNVGIISSLDQFAINEINVGTVASGVDAITQGVNVANAINQITSRTGVSATVATATGAITLITSGGNRIEISGNVANTGLTVGITNGNDTLRNSFANDLTQHELKSGKVINERQGLSKALRPKADY